ncbi:tetratricopeptide repeat protein [Rhodopseudomonas boonkerdii]|uniref:tetratricopeptide repeat protein n=1 Tax=Rhodopseudomonas boonkerdii TaxID=475937 RepID=UPI001E36358D|nr:tetratricopeptide repeat protein [Rhodopseudomonas boonkerdii]
MSSEPVQYAQPRATGAVSGNVSGAVAKRRLHVRTRDYLAAQIRDRTVAELAMFAKGLAVVLVTVVPIVLTVIVVSKAMIENGIVMTALRVPQSLEAAGYTAETATQRLLDEIATLNRNSNAAKPKTALGDTQLIDALSSIETPAGNIDLKSFQSLIQKVLGKKIVQISGEITTRNEDGKELLRLRLRQTPGREGLIDVETAAGAENLFRKAALNLLEHIDPEIAAGIYFREYGDEESAMRLTAVALAGGHKDAEKYALNLRTYIYLSRGQVAEAMQATESARAMDPDFVAAEYTRAFVLLAQKKPEDALEAVRRGVERAPQSDNSYNSLGIVLNAMGRKDEAIDAHRTALSKNARSIVAYRRLAAVFREARRDKEASEALLTGVAVVPSSAMLQLDYGEDLQRQGRNYEAIGPLRKAFEAQPDNIRFQIALAETEHALGHAAEAVKLAASVKSRLGSGEKFSGNIRQRADALVARVGSGTEAVAK